MLIYFFGFWWLFWLLYYGVGVFDAIIGNKICEMLDSRLSKHVADDGMFLLVFSIVYCHVHLFVDCRFYAICM